VGVDLGTPVTTQYVQHHNAFNGTIARVTISVGPVGSADMPKDNPAAVVTE
jgi:hypothetical protein